MLTSFARAVRQLADPRLRGVMWRGLAVTLALYVALYAAVAWGLSHLHFFAASWLNGAADILGWLLVSIITVMLFPSVAIMSLSFFLEDAALAVEAAYYPDMPEARRQGMPELVWGAARFALVALLVNILALPVYILFAVIGVGIGLYYIVNGYLLAREYFEQVALRRLEPDKADALRRANLGRLWLVGAALAFLSTVPILNLVSPVIATAVMIHEFELLRRRAPF